jgi:hypothetical protein
MVRAARQSNVVWRRTNQVYLGILLTCIPVSYAVPVKPFTEYRESLKKQRNQQTDGEAASETAPSPASEVSHQ